MLVFVSLSCSEDLPSYHEPKSWLDTTIDGEYWLSDVDHCLRIYIRITNTFDETLEAKGLLTGTVVAFFARDPSIHKTISLNSANLVSGGYSSDGVLRIDPGKSIVLMATWSFAGDKVPDDRGRDLASRAEGSATFFTFVEDKTCEARKFARPEDLVLQAEVTVFDSKPTITVGPRVFPFCFVSNFVSVKVCPRVYTIPPCSNWPK